VTTEARPLGLAFLALGAAWFAFGAGGLEHKPALRRLPASTLAGAVAADGLSPLSTPPRLAAPERPATATTSSAFLELSPLTFVNRNSRETLTTRLYRGDGTIDEESARQLDQLLADRRRPGQVHSISLDRRLLMLVFRAAYHFEAGAVHVISAYRALGRKHEGYHALGRAIDFSLPGIKSPALASYLRKHPRVGVGVYTHPRTQYVHLDVRDVSYHWLDASPPGRHWRGMRLTDNAAAARDASYRTSDDWPEGLAPR